MVTRLRSLISRLRFAWSRHRLDRETRDEIDAHLALLIDRYRRAGMTEAEARRAAYAQFGNVTIVREDTYRMNGLRWLDALHLDLRYALRQVRHNPGFAAVVIATLGLGIGGTTAVFSVVRSVIVAPLPYDEADRLIRLYQQEPGNLESRSVLTALHIATLRDGITSFEHLAGIYTYNERGLDLARGGQAVRLRVLPVSSGYLGLLRAAPQLGRDFRADDELGVRRILLSDRTWRTHFDADPSIVGRAIRLSGDVYDVIGVAAPDLEDPLAGSVDAWLPFPVPADTAPDNHSLDAIARLRPGVTLLQAQTELDLFGETIRQRWPEVRRYATAAVPLQADVVAPARGPLALVSIAVVLLLLVACVNVANLALVRATGRSSEFALRAALGGGRGQLARQLLVESLVLAIGGGLVGLAIAAFGVDVLRTLGRDAIPRLGEVGFDRSVLMFAAAVSVGTALTFGIAPAMRFARADPQPALRRQSRSLTSDWRQRAMRSGLAAAQLAFALVLLAGAGVLLASLRQVQRVDLGFRSEGVLSFEVNLPTARYDVERRIAFHEDFARAARAIPGVIAAGATSRLPATGSFHPWNTRIVTGPRAGFMMSRGNGFTLQQRTISGDFFTALRIPLIAGRTFDARDDRQAPPRAVVSRSFASQAFPGLPPAAAIGQGLVVAGEPREIIGVVGDTALDPYGTGSLTVYHTHRQFAVNRNWSLTQVVATNRPTGDVLAAVRAEVARLDPELVVHRVMNVSEAVGRGTGRERFALVLMGAFALVAVLLAGLGLYGVLAYAVRQRTPEIAIRLALGATTANVRGLVLRQAASVIVAGTAIGLAGALLLGRWLSSLVFEVSPRDPVVLTATALLLVTIGSLAAWIPMRRATRIDPRTAMSD